MIELRTILKGALTPERLQTSRLWLFYTASSAGLLAETLLLSIGAMVLVAAILTGSPAGLARFIGQLTDHYLAAPEGARAQFLSGILVALAIVTIFVGCLRGPAQLRRLRQDAKARFAGDGRPMMPPMERREEASDD